MAAQALDQILAGRHHGAAGAGQTAFSTGQTLPTGAAAPGGSATSAAGLLSPTTLSALTTVQAIAGEARSGR